jgi:antitoxin component YwqK of YwqJK toxin-antitoxin module
MKRLAFLLLLASCHHSSPSDSLSLIQIQDRNGLTETISNPDRLNQYKIVDFLSTQPYKKVLRVYKENGKNSSFITTYHPNGMICQYLEAEEMRAHGAYKEWFPNGQIKIEATVIGGNADVTPDAQETWLFEGVSQVYDENGNIMAQIPYSKGELGGVSTYYYPSGQIKTEVPFEKNEMEGDAVEYLESGLVKSKIHFQKGVKEGEALTFFDDGSLVSRENYSEGLLQSGVYYTPQGEKISEVQNGRGSQAIYNGKELTLIEIRGGFVDGVIRKMNSSNELYKLYHIKDGKKSGEEIEFYSGSSPKLSVYWSENMIHGSVKTWYNTGQIQSQREYSRNQRSGPALAWYPNGALMLLEEYEEDRLLSGQYYKMNKSEPVSTISNGNGVATLYDETGAFNKKVQYVKGKPAEPD